MRPRSCASVCHGPQNAHADKVGDLDCSFARAEAAAWDTFQDFLLNYDIPTKDQLDLLEVYAYADSRLTEMIRQCGGKAEHFTQADGDLATVEGQRKLFELVQRKQPRNIWVAPECGFWGSWARFNASRSESGWLRLQEARSRDMVHVHLCARLFAWQVQRKRHFHLEQPEQSQMLSLDPLKNVGEGTYRIRVDMCAFGLAESLLEKVSPRNHVHTPVAGRTRQIGGGTVAV